MQGHTTSASVVHYPGTTCSFAMGVSAVGYDLLQYGWVVPLQAHKAVVCIELGFGFPSVHLPLQLVCANRCPICLLPQLSRSNWGL